ncbi:MAG: bifunctional alpha,alpha-trehalose-phosphate synthase (UDP-forming)/trehalose-phosphatase [Bacteroidota bacterium]
MTEAGKKRILIVSNRLPVSIQYGGHGPEVTASSGGLVTGLLSLQSEFGMEWIGWPGVVAKADRPVIERTLKEEYGFHPVFMSEHTSERYYEGFSNRSIWPTFHSLPSYAKFLLPEWEAYKKANRLFAEKVLELYQPGDTIWIHDYHLLLLSQQLRERIPDATIGFFLHIPFPHYDIFRLMPQHREILESMLALDLIGFHTHDYAQAFLGCVRRILGRDNTLGQIMVGNRIVQVDVFPMGIDFQKYSTAVRDPILEGEIGKIRRRMGSRKTVFKVSRLDYTKGVPESLRAIRTFFRRYPPWHEKIVFVLVVVPSRERVERYAALKREIDELVGNINSEFGTLDWTPIRYIYRSLTFGELVGLYQSADIALVTPLRDGMNLIAKEYLAVKEDNTGVLILSELAGAAKELVEAIQVNPNSDEEICEALNVAVSMPIEEQQRRNRPMRQRLETHDIHQWTQQFFTRLRDIRETTRNLEVKQLDDPTKKRIQSEFMKATTRLILLDYDGTLVPFAGEPHLATPDNELVATLKHLSVLPDTTTVILSGRDKDSLDAWFNTTGAILVAEHGGWVKRSPSEEWEPTIAPSSDSWKKEIRPILDLHVDRIPGSFVEEKNFSLVWHYRKAESESASFAARELLDMLSNLTTNLDIHILPGNKTIEVRTTGISKGAFYLRFFATVQFPFIIAAGDDWTDEDLFAVLPPEAYSIKVGLQMSKARYNVPAYQDIRSLLHELTEAAHARH